ncbi:VOC family protein [Nitrospirillum iridis]|uniref:Catechol 2,3-dioxygenase-like lactoylglutathione lyase family enzyme n=1 Tax=Nitrospirillum iridis TaxID=765888 RepID=A0A7X0AUN4_9PROT|nr:VOC family protein [Nitrospirillum iridis]MBB6250429.1 catechol 2,3-dioxygenase-like lactoylglutathione lyase family enzyme [Nitrospirillum iridis]
MALCLLTAPPAAATDGPVVTAPAVTGLDHIPIAVNDLDTAAARFRALGFALKPGVTHADGIRNQHVKFPDGTELELITAPTATDELTADYRRLLAAGDAPAFLGLYAPDHDALPAVLASLAPGYHRDGPMVGFPTNDPLHFLFFWHRNQSPTDRPEHFAHANGGQSLIGVWLASDDASLPALLSGLGGVRDVGLACTPDCMMRRQWRFQEGTITLLPADRQRLPGRPVVGAVIRVASLEQALAAVKAVIPAPTVVHAAEGDSILIPPDTTAGLWLELRAVRP